ncbi:hypothetical protein EGW08_018923 [Elysia chlorotica]|uniref:Uncharacterized protein n=1 Tax=Elysia chlorotica TaxID=188477 RepID=A0A3S1AVH8_ELYCH|nr:hypothetical protein EGW08_018923 [Elysia chlorotica]
MGQHTMPAIKHLQRSVTSYENHGAFRWNKPSFQAFQLRPWTKDREIEETLRGSLGIYGPGVASEISSRAKSVPAREKNQMGLDRDEVRTAHSVSNMREFISLAPKSSLEAMPVRPPLSKTKQIPGRYFPKATPADTARVVSFSVYRRYRPPVRARAPAIGNSKSLDTNNLPLESVSFLDTLPKSHRASHSPNFGGGRRIKKPNRSFGVTEFPEIKSEIFAICFNNMHVSGGSSRHPKEENGGEGVNGAGEKSVGKQPQYDPNSELHSDYYTIKRLSLGTPSSKAGSSARAFSVVLRGQPKLLHPKLVLMGEDATQEMHPNKGTEVGARSTDSSVVGAAENQNECTAEAECDNASPSEGAKLPGPKVMVKIDTPVMPPIDMVALS